MPRARDARETVQPDERRAKKRSRPACLPRPRDAADDPGASSVPGTEGALPDAILFFRLGDFYETFDRDAQIVSRALDIVLTGRDIGRGERVPMAGVPYHAAEGYIARLIEQGHRVALCEQIGEVPLKGLVKREVVRVITPGTLVEEGLLPVPREQLPGRRPDRACWRRAGLG